ncbi:MAG: nitroreductase family protein [Rikenellaceae bacterium]
MKFSWQILTLLLAVALVVLSIKVSTQTAPPPAEAVDVQAVVLENIMTRSSVRSYTDQKIESEKIETLLKAGMAAPTGGNKQPWEFIVVTEREILDEIPEYAAGAKMIRKAQTAIVVCGDTSRCMPGTLVEYWIQDCSAATENILLAAHAMGLGAVWCGAYPNNDQDRVGKLKELFNLPESVYALSVIVLGYPDSEPMPKNKWDEEKVHYNKF